MYKGTDSFCPHLHSAGCHFSHPPKTSQTFNRSKFSATFNKPSPTASDSPSTTTTKPTSTPAKASVGEWPKENPQHVSERLKRFAVQNDGETEKIIPGQTTNGGNGEEKDGDKVEIHLDDEDDQKEKEKEKEKKEVTA